MLKIIVPKRMNLPLPLFVVSPYGKGKFAIRKSPLDGISQKWVTIA
jgi:hypothetical protein